LFQYFYYLPPLEPSDTIEEETARKGIVFGVLGTVIIAVLILFGLPNMMSCERQLQEICAETDLEGVMTGPISITNVTLDDSSGICAVHFTLLNSDDNNGYAVVEMYTWGEVFAFDGVFEVEGRIILEKERFFVRTNTAEKEYMQSKLVQPYWCVKTHVKVEIIKIE